MGSDMTMSQGKITELLDREAIRDCIYRYCRGVDRADEASLRGAYWPDATDQHGPYSGPVEGFFFASNDNSGQFGVVRYHHSKRSVGLDDVDALDVYLIEITNFATSGKTR